MKRTLLHLFRGCGLNKLKRLSRALSRKARGSNNRAKAKTKLARLHRRIADIRADALHKLTTYLTKHRTIVIEDLNVAGMLANRHLSRAIADVGFFEFRRQLEYKAAMAGSRVVVADRWYPSSKLCSACVVKNGTLTLSERTWTCASCGTSHCRCLLVPFSQLHFPGAKAAHLNGSRCPKVIDWHGRTAQSTGQTLRGTHAMRMAILGYTMDPELQVIEHKVEAQIPLSFDDGLALLRTTDLH